MNGLSTKARLHAVTQSPVLSTQSSHQCDDAYAHPAARARIMGYGDAEEFTLPRRVFMPNFTADSLGTPGEARRDREARMDILYARIFVAGIALVLALIAIGFAAHAPPPAPAQPMRTRAEYHAQARSLRPGESVVVRSNWNEDCMVTLHKEAVGKLTHAAVAWRC